MDGCEIEAWNTMFDRRFLVLTVFYQFTVRLRMLLSPLMWLNIVKICMPMIRQVYLTPLRNYYYFASGIDLSTDCQLIMFCALWFQHAPELSKEVDCGGKWDGIISHTGLEKSFPSNVCFFQCRQSGSSGVKWSRKLFDENSQDDGLGECSILDRTAIPHSHHSRRLFWPQSSLKKASHEKDTTGIHCHALSPTTCIIALWSRRSMNPEVRYAEMRQCIEHRTLPQKDWSMFEIDQYICGGCGLTRTLAIPHSYW